MMLRVLRELKKSAKIVYRFGSYLKKNNNSKLRLKLLPGKPANLNCRISSLKSLAGEQSKSS
uniref:Uncharacterized protein n=1 Tax=Romanomermis culicivorax TaxID=13658 RepID=A0A915K556_ROMCU